MKNPGRLHMDPPNVRNIADILREAAAALDGAAAAAPEGRDTTALRDIAKRARSTSEFLGADFWDMLRGEDATWEMPEADA